MNDMVHTNTNINININMNISILHGTITLSRKVSR